jgi:hypothetical protein
MTRYATIISDGRVFVHDESWTKTAARDFSRGARRAVRERKLTVKTCLVKIEIVERIKS